MWRGNFHRLFRDNAILKSSWNHSGFRLHRPERFGRLRFAAGTRAGAV